MFNAVIDTNVILSSLLSHDQNSATVKVIKKALGGFFVPIYSSEVMEEYVEVLHRDKFALDGSTIISTLKAIIQNGEEVIPVKFDGEISDEKDRIFISTALASENCFIITGNLKHFLPYYPLAVSPLDMLRIIGE